MLKTVKVLGDGNCAFNAFVLGLFAFANDYDLEDEKHIKICNALLDLYKQAYPDYDKTVSNLKNRLSNQTSKNNLENMQKKFASLLRELAIKLIKKDKKNHLNLTSELVFGAFDEFKKNGKDTEDDIFTVHKFIKDKFTELNKLKDKNLVEVTLSTWWKSNGYPNFLKEIEKDGSWVGDLELKYLSEFFEIDIEIFRNRKIISKAYNCGALSDTFLNKNYLASLNGIIIEGGDENNPRRLFFRDINEFVVCESLFF